LIGNIFAAWAIDWEMPVSAERMVLPSSYYPTIRVSVELFGNFVNRENFGLKKLQINSTLTLTLPLKFPLYAA